MHLVSPVRKNDDLIFPKKKSAFLKAYTEEDMLGLPKSNTGFLSLQQKSTRIQKNMSLHRIESVNEVESCVRGTIENIDEDIFEDEKENEPVQYRAHTVDVMNLQSGTDTEEGWETIMAEILNTLDRLRQLVSINSNSNKVV